MGYQLSICDPLSRTQMRHSNLNSQIKFCQLMANFSNISFNKYRREAIHHLNTLLILWQESELRTNKQLIHATSTNQDATSEYLYG
ncbi:hypothetical protein T02_2702 [Trichinella nativa]|uniref:Uncharacterized protein n=1 Tax=Trichinella nativa TaxID=6335 RepID=A0A0V1LUD9_9BILA|nr:hypothetical protein T02_2702 [Trichinella nativa]